MNKEREVRFLPLEIRAEQNEQEYVLEGYPIVFNQETDMGGWREVIDPAAIGDGRILRDVALMIGHDSGMIPLAHSRNNTERSTMQLTPDDHGVAMRAVLDAGRNPRAAEAYSAVTRGDISGMSFAFIVEGEAWEELDTDKPLRRITSLADIFEVSLVAFPAYKGTSVQAASEGDALESVRASLESAKQKLAEEREAQAEAERRTALIERLNKITEVSSDEV